MGNSCSSFKLYLEKKVARSSRRSSRITRNPVRESKRSAGSIDVRLDATFADAGETDHQGRPAGAARARVDPRQLGRVAREPPETAGAPVGAEARRPSRTSSCGRGRLRGARGIDSEGRRAAVKAWPPNAQCAFYINADNILCAEHACRTIRNGGGPAGQGLRPDGVKKEIWDVRRGRAARRCRLNEIEHGVIRTRWDEPRVHACVNCASRSCPICSARPIAAITASD